MALYREKDTNGLPLISERPCLVETSTRHSLNGLQRLEERHVSLPSFKNFEGN